MTDHLPDVELTDAQDDRATAIERAVIERPASAACLIVHLQDRVAELERDVTKAKEAWDSAFQQAMENGARVAELTESLRQQESQLRTALDELRSATSAVDAETEFSWLIELRGFSRPLYFSPGWGANEWHWICTHADDAVRFPRKIDAQRVINLFERLDAEIMKEPSWEAVEHGWIMRDSVTTPDVRDVDCPACGKPMSAHKGELKPGAVLWCP